MTLHKLLESAADRLNNAALRIEQAREAPASPEQLTQWMEALTQYVMALSEIHTLNNESIHEKLHELAGRAGLRPFPSSPTG